MSNGAVAINGEHGFLIVIVACNEFHIVYIVSKEPFLRLMLGWHTWQRKWQRKIIPNFCAQNKAKKLDVGPSHVVELQVQRLLRSGILLFFGTGSVKSMIVNFGNFECRRSLQINKVTYLTFYTPTQLGFSAKRTFKTQTQNFFFRSM